MGSCILHDHLGKLITSSLLDLGCPAYGQGCFQVIAGRLCDIYGRKKGLLLGAAIWILFSVLSIFMPVSSALASA